MFVADLPPEVPPTFISAICSEKKISLDDVKYKNLTPEKLLKIAESVNGKKIRDKEDLRLKIISKSAFEFGAQGGYYQRIKDIKNFLKKYEVKLDTVFNFQSLMTNGGKVVPPIINSSRNTYNQEDFNSIRTSKLNYNIVEQARFSPVPPNWRNYLYFDEGAKPRIPDRAVYPKTSEEKKVWEKTIKSGWKSGVCQANKGYALNISRLRRDYLGMVRYHILLKKEIVSVPFVAQSEKKIIGRSDSIKIGDRLLRITVKPGFNLNSDKWDAVIQQEPFYDNVTNNIKPIKITESKKTKPIQNSKISAAHKKDLIAVNRKAYSKAGKFSVHPKPIKKVVESIHGVDFGKGLISNRVINGKDLAVKVKGKKNNER